MKPVNYLERKIILKKCTPQPRYGMTVAGYTRRAGAPTVYMIRLEDENVWRRVMVWQFSNAGTCFVRINKVDYVLKFDALEDVPMQGAAEQR